MKTSSRIALILVVLHFSAASGRAKFMSPELVPVDRLVKSAETYLTKHPEDAEAQYTLGVMYLEGKGVVRDEVEAFKWIAVAAAAGNTNAGAALTGLRAAWPREIVTKGEIRAMDHLSRTNSPPVK